MKEAFQPAAENSGRRKQLKSHQRSISRLAAASAAAAGSGWRKHRVALMAAIVIIINGVCQPGNGNNGIEINGNGVMANGRR
jgi:hypothetical protein